MSSSHSHLSPLLFNEKTNEPYLRLPLPHTNIILTPPRDADNEAIVKIMNDQRVFQWLESTPYPYYLEHAKAWLEVTSRQANTVLQQLEETPGGFVGGCPVRILREVKDNGEESFLGDCGIGKWGFADILDPGEREKARRENDQRPPGDPGTVWGFGGATWRGIMSLAIGTLIEQWMKPRMRARIICANVWTGNYGSVKVFEKNGFVLEKTLENFTARPESKGGGLMGVHVMRRRL